MKKLPIRVEYLVLGVIIVGLGLAIALRGTGRMRYRLPALPALKTEDIGRFTVAKAGGSLELEKREGVWRILPQGFKADEGTVSTMVRALAEIELTSLVSEAGSYPRYELDEAGRMTLTAYIADKEARVLEVGKQDDGGRASFVMIPGDSRVYRSRQNFRELFDVTPDKIRDMIVMSFTREDITEITARRGAETLTLTRSSTGDPPVVSWKSTAGLPWDKDAVDRMLGALRSLRAQRFGEKGDDIGPEQVALTLKTADGTSHMLSIHDKVDTQYGATSSQSEYPFYLAEYQRTNVMDIFDARESDAGAEGSGSPN